MHINHSSTFSGSKLVLIFHKKGAAKLMCFWWLGIKHTVITLFTDLCETDHILRRKHFLASLWYPDYVSFVKLLYVLLK